MERIERVFRPEFINRLDEIIIFDELLDEDLRKIVDLQIGKLNELLEKRTLQIRLTTEAQTWLIDKTCADRSYGARPLKRALQKYVEDELSEALIQGIIEEGNIIEIITENDKLAFRVVQFKEVEKEFFEQV